MKTRNVVVVVAIAALLVVSLGVGLASAQTSVSNVTPSVSVAQAQALLQAAYPGVAITSIGLEYEHSLPLYNAILANGAHVRVDGLTGAIVLISPAGFGSGAGVIENEAVDTESGQGMLSEGAGNAADQ